MSFYKRSLNLVCIGSLLFTVACSSKKSSAPLAASVISDSPTPEVQVAASPIPSASPAQVVFNEISSSLTGGANTSFATGLEPTPSPSPMAYGPSGGTVFSFNKGTGYKVLSNDHFIDARSMVQIPSGIHAGKFYTSFYYYGEFQDRNADGRAHVIGRLNADGTWDSTFASNGMKLLSDFITPYFSNPSSSGGGNAWYSLQVNAIAVDSTDASKLLFAGHQVIDGGGLYVLFVCRLNASGAFDATFNAGSVNTGCYTYIEDTLGTTWGPFFSWGNGAFHSSAAGMAIDSQGRIVVTGRYSEAPDNSVHSIFTLRLNANGTPDTSFGSAGRLVDYTSAGAEFSSGKQIAFDQSGNIYILGSIGSAANIKTAVYKYTETGVAIGTQPILQTNAILAKQMRLDSSGRIVLAGTSFDSVSHQSRITAARYSATGVLDTQFANSGFYKMGVDSMDSGMDDSIWFSVNNIARTLLIDANGKILLGGSILGTRNSDYYGPEVLEARQAILLRLTSQGALDSTFGVAGKITWINDADLFADNLSFNDSAYYEYATSGIAVMIPNQNDGSIIATGCQLAAYDTSNFYTKYYIWNFK